ncbi:hypothetical protein [Vibrio aestuarianus]|nr:hypothetical protein [Vibrio aestuarianus]
MKPVLQYPFFYFNNVFAVSHRFRDVVEQFGMQLLSLLSLA